MGIIKETIVQIDGKKNQYRLRLDDDDANIYYKKPPVFGGKEHYPLVTEAIITVESLTTFPSLLYDLPALQSLFISRFSGPLPADIDRLEMLTKLSLYMGRPTPLPESIGRLQHLQELKLDRIGPADLPTSLGQLRKLQALIIENTPVLSLPDSLRDLSELTNLTLLGAGIYGSIPEFIFHLRSLKNIDLRDNNIEEIPSRILDLPELKKLQFSGNPIALSSGKASDGLKLVRSYFADHTEPLGSDPIGKFGLMLKQTNEQMKAHGGNKNTLQLSSLSPTQKGILEELLTRHLLLYHQIAYERIVDYYADHWPLFGIEIHVKSIELPEKMDPDTSWSLTLGRDTFDGPVVVFDLKGWEVEDVTLVG